jgi:hypothetical protein
MTLLCMGGDLTARIGDRIRGGLYRQDEKLCGSPWTDSPPEGRAGTLCCVVEQKFGDVEGVSKEDQWLEQTKLAVRQGFEPYDRVFLTW